MQETVYDLPFVRHAVRTFERLQGTTTDRRVGWLIGTPGTGKSVALRHLRRLSPADTALAIVDKNWCDNRTAINTGIAEALCVTVEKNAGLTWRRIIEHLQACPTTLLLDEFHEGGVLLMKSVKSLINAAPGARVIVATIPTAYDKLIAGRTDEMIEAQQLLGRTLRPLRQDWREGLGSGDILGYLDAVVPEFDEATRHDLAATLGPRVNRTYGLRILADTIEVARGDAEASDRDLTADAIIAAFALLTKDGRPEVARR